MKRLILTCGLLACISVATAASSAAIRQYSADHKQITADYNQQVSDCKELPKQDQSICLSDARQVRDDAIRDARARRDSASASSSTSVAPSSSTSRPASSRCADCGVIAEIREIKQAASGSGLGAVAGGIVGGLLGNEVGKGRGRKVATVAGVAGGAYAGHEIEKVVREVTVYDIVLRMDGGTSRTVRVETKGDFAVGQRIRIEDGVLVHHQ